MLFQYKFSIPIKNLYELEVYLYKSEFKINHINYNGDDLFVYTKNELTNEQQQSMEEKINIFYNDLDKIDNFSDSATNLLSKYNSYSGILTEDFEGVYENIRNYTSLTVSCFSDNMSIENGLEIIFSTDGVNSFYKKTYTVYPNQIIIDIITINFPFFKVIYKNRSTTQITIQVSANLYKQKDPTAITTRNEIIVKEEEPPNGFKPTNGYFRTESFKILCEPGNSEHFFSWDYPISCSIIKFIVKSENIGDIIDTYVAPDTIVGILNENYEANSNVIKIPVEYLGFINEGFLIKISDHNFGEVKSINKSTSSITISTPCENVINFGNLIKISMHNIKNFYLIENGTVNIGGIKIGSSYIPKNTQIKLVYNNTALINKTFYFIAEYSY